jgi:hypothetical protein
MCPYKKKICDVCDLEFVKAEHVNFACEEGGENVHDERVASVFVLLYQ